MRKRSGSLCCLFALAVPLWGQQPEVVIRPALTQQLAKLAVADFSPRSVATQEVQETLQNFNDVLWADLQFSGFFQMPSKSFYPLKPLRLPQDVDFDLWRVPTLDVDFLIFGNLQVEGTAAVVEAYLYDVKTRQQVLGKRYRVGDRNLVRRAAHEFADQVVYQLSAGTSRGVARTQIAFTSARGGSKEIYVVDYDGANPRTITANGGLNKFPAWSPDGSRLAFVVKLPEVNRWELWIQPLAGARTLLPVDTSYVSSPAWSPDGTRLAFASRRGQALDSDIFVASPQGGDWRNLTQHPAIDTSPTWSPTGGQIAFISDRSGSPQLWMMDADGSNVERLVGEGGHCDSPSWSPDGRWIAYSWQAPGQWKHDIYLVEVATRRIFQLTSGRGDHESPSWSPDGRHLVFQSTRTGTKQIFIMNANGENLRQITTYGINESPVWSPYPDQSP